MADRPFELHVVRRGENDYGLALYQRPAGRERVGTNGHWPLVVQTWDTPLKSVMDQVLSTIKGAGYRTTDLTRSRKDPFGLTEAQGVRIGLLFLAVKPLRKVDRMIAISEQVRSMTDEEAYYWFSKATAPVTARRGQRAMRVLLADE